MFSSRRISLVELPQYPRRESNPNLKNRNLPFYPLNYEGVTVFFFVQRYVFSLIMPLYVER